MNRKSKSPQQISITFLGLSARFIATSIFLVLFIATVSANSISRSISPNNNDDRIKATHKVFDEMVKIFRENGADIEEFKDLSNGRNLGLTLETQDFKEIVNKYNNYQTKIYVSRMVDIDEAPEYWENWSNVLAAGNFDHKRFFVDDEERLKLANFNVIVLMAHEIGHYLDYRYMISDIRYVSGMLQNTSPLNCSEGFADNFAVAFIDHLATDAEFRDIRTRYIELIAEFNRSIPEKNRYDFASKNYNEQSCEEIDLLENGLNADGYSVNENFFRQYASAYFNRHLVKLGENNNEDLKTVIKKRLVEPYLKRMQYSPTKVSLKTTKTVSELELGADVFLALDKFRDAVAFDLSMLDLGEKIQIKHPKTLTSNILNDKGEPRTVKINYVSDVLSTADQIDNDDQTFIFNNKEFTLNVKDNEKNELLNLAIKPPRKISDAYNFSAVIMPTDDELLLVLNPFDNVHYEIENRKTFDRVLVLHVKKLNGKWKTKFRELKVKEVKNSVEIAGSWFVTPQGKIRFLRRHLTEKPNKAEISVYQYEPRSGKAGLIRPAFVSDITELNYNESVTKGAKRRYNWESGAVGNDEGKLLISGSEEVAQTRRADNLFELNGDPRLLIGNFYGNSDGKDPLDMKISFIYSYRFIEQNKLVILSRFADETYLREVVFF